MGWNRFAFYEILIPQKKANIYVTVTFMLPFYIIVLKSVINLHSKIITFETGNVFVWTPFICHSYISIVFFQIIFNISSFCNLQNLQIWKINGTWKFLVWHRSLRCPQHTDEQRKFVRRYLLRIDPEGRFRIRPDG